MQANIASFLFLIRSAQERKPAWRGGVKRPIANRPQVANLPHLVCKAVYSRTEGVIQAVTSLYASTDPRPVT